MSKHFHCAKFSEIFPISLKIDKLIDTDALNILIQIISSY